MLIMYYYDVKDRLLVPETTDQPSDVASSGEDTSDEAYKQRHDLME